MYKFRVTFSTDVNQHYTFDGEDTTVSMVVVADTFSWAEMVAKRRLEEMIRDYGAFEIVSVQNLTVIALEEERKNNDVG